jgi:phosphonate transport system substrate-binding protein
MDRITAASLMSENENFIFSAIMDYLSQESGVQIEIISGLSWQERERLFDAGQVGIVWICGLPYVTKADSPGADIELLAAPVMSDSRYDGRPIYFSDVVVHMDCHFRRFSDLKGTSWCYNEPNSHSGYNAVKYHLANLGEKNGFFGRVTESGSHMASLDLIKRREVDASAIDSIVLGIELRNHPELRSAVRVIETIGPSPIPPLATSLRLQAGTRDKLRKALTGMKDTRRGQIALTKCGMTGLAAIRDADYDVIRQMARAGMDVVLGQSVA